MMVLVDVVKGTAKTTTARALDELLGWTFQDVKM
jgi:Mg-chelatase subunit ChlI